MFRSLMLLLLASVLVLGGCGGSDDDTTTGSHWKVTVANNIGSPLKVAETYALANAHGRRGSCANLKARMAAGPACVYGAALAGCYAGQTGGPTLKGGGVVPMRDEVKLRTVYDYGFRDCGGQLGDGPVVK